MFTFGGDDEKDLTPQPQPSRPQVAARPVSSPRQSLKSVKRGTKTNSFQSSKSAPAIAPRPQKPKQVKRSPLPVIRPVHRPKPQKTTTFRELQLAYGGSLYDMRSLLNEPHPFANLRLNKSAGSVERVVPPSGVQPSQTPGRGAVATPARDGPGVIIYEKPSRSGEIDSSFKGPVSWPVPPPQKSSSQQLHVPVSQYHAQPLTSQLQDAFANLAPGQLQKPKSSVSPAPLKPRPVYQNYPAPEVQRPEFQHPDSLFNLAYRYERARQYYEAEQTYEKILLHHSSSQTAVLANTRLDNLRRGRVHVATRSGTTLPSAPQVQTRAQNTVVAVNSPSPISTNQYAASLHKRKLGLTAQPDALYRTVCSRKGLYEDGAQWCGIVTRAEKNHYLVEVRDVRLNVFGTIGISRSTCTGKTFINWFSRGSTVRVPKECMVLRN